MRVNSNNKCKSGKNRTMVGVGFYSFGSVDGTRNRAQGMVILVVLASIGLIFGVADIIFFADKIPHVDDKVGQLWRIALIGPFVAIVAMAIELYFIMEWLRAYRASIIQGGAGEDFAVPGAKDAIYTLSRGGKGSDINIPKNPVIPANVQETYNEIYHDASHYRNRVSTYSTWGFIVLVIQIIFGVGGSGVLLAWSIVVFIRCNSDVLCSGDTISDFVHTYWLGVFIALFALMFIFLCYSAWWAYRWSRHSRITSDASVGSTSGSRRKRNVQDKNVLIGTDEESSVSVQMGNSDFSTSSYDNGKYETEVILNSLDSTATGLHNRQTNMTSLGFGSQIVPSAAREEFVEPTNENIWANSDKE